MHIFCSFLTILIFSIFIFIFQNFYKFKIKINSQLMKIKNEQKLIREELFILKKNFFNQTNNDKIIKNKNQINLKNLNDSLNQMLNKNENNI